MLKIFTHKAHQKDKQFNLIDKHIYIILIKESGILTGNQTVVTAVGVGILVTKPHANR